ncbi:MAG: polysaccharide biosynthesis protein [Chloroflexi bacterium]|nr:polysaccharide biosynthesis protein [Chloroflexota bacterium]
MSELPPSSPSESEVGDSGLGRWLRLIPVLALDALLVVASYAAALGLKFDGDVPRESMVFFGQVVAVIVLAYLAGNYFFGIYRTAWQYASVADAMSLASAVGLVSIVLIGVNVFLTPRHIPLTVTATAPALVFLSMGVAKLWPRLRAQQPFTTWGGPAQRVLIAGAGHTGQMLAREFLQHPEWEYRPIGFVDDDPRKRGTRIHGLAVLGGRYDIPRLVERHAVDAVALAIPSAGGAVTREFVGICQQADVAVRTVPGVPEMVRPGATARLREITVDDLLGREEPAIDTAACASMVRGKEVLITGAAGYLGQELARQLLAFGPAVLHLLDSNETGLYDLQRDLAEEGNEVRFWMTDIADEVQVQRTFRRARPHVIFHTAAYKHIPVIEDHPAAAFQVNVRGTMNLCRAADASGAEHFILISTNKAADLDTVYGATKRIGELLAVALSKESKTRYSAVRLHNVIGSRGSVVPLFLRQIERGGPVLLTHADISRFFMSPPEAVRLLIQSAAIAETGQVFVLDLGEEVKIGDLAEKLIRLRGYQPGKDIQIVYSGLRPGEQLHEVPLAERGQLASTSHPKIFLTEEGPACSAGEIIGRIEALQRELPESRDDLVARLHALARIDMRDVQPAPAVSDS